MRFDGEKLTKRLRDKDMSIGELHRLMVRAGSDIARATLHRWVKGDTRYPSEADLNCLCAVLRVRGALFFTAEPREGLPSAPVEPSVAAAARKRGGADCG